MPVLQLDLLVALLLGCGAGIFTGLAPGIHEVKVEGSMNGKPVAAEKAVALAAGSVTTVEVTLA